VKSISKKLIEKLENEKTRYLNYLKCDMGAKGIIILQLNLTLLTILNSERKRN